MTKFSAKILRVFKAVWRTMRNFGDLMQNSAIIGRVNFVKACELMLQATAGRHLDYCVLYYHVL